MSKCITELSNSLSDLQERLLREDASSFIETIAAVIQPMTSISAYVKRIAELNETKHQASASKSEPKQPHQLVVATTETLINEFIELSKQELESVTVIVEELVQPRAKPDVKEQVSQINLPQIQNLAEEKQEEFLTTLENPVALLAKNIDKLNSLSEEEQLQALTELQQACTQIRGIIAEAPQEATVDIVHTEFCESLTDIVDIVKSSIASIETDQEQSLSSPTIAARAEIIKSLLVEPLRKLETSVVVSNLSSGNLQFAVLNESVEQFVRQQATLTNQDIPEAAVLESQEMAMQEQYKQKILSELQSPIEKLTAKVTELQTTMAKSQVIEVACLEELQSCGQALHQAVVTISDMWDSSEEVLKTVVNSLDKPLMSFVEDVNSVIESVAVGQATATRVSVANVIDAILPLEQSLERLDECLTTSQIVSENAPSMTNFADSVKLLAETIYECEDKIKGESSKSKTKKKIKGAAASASAAIIKSEEEVNKRAGDEDEDGGGEVENANKHNISVSYETQCLINDAARDIARLRKILLLGDNNQQSAAAVSFSDLQQVKRIGDKLHQAIVATIKCERDREGSKAIERVISGPLVNFLLNLDAILGAALNSPETTEFPFNAIADSAAPLSDALVKFTSLVDNGRIVVSTDVFKLTNVIQTYVDQVEIILIMGKKQKQLLLTPREEQIMKSNIIEDKLQTSTQELVDNITQLHASLQQFELMETNRLKQLKEISESLHLALTTEIKSLSMTDECQVVAFDNALASLVQCIDAAITSPAIKSQKEISVTSNLEHVTSLRVAFDELKASLTNFGITATPDQAALIESLQSCIATIDKVDERNRILMDDEVKVESPTESLEESQVMLTMVLDQFQYPIIKLTEAMLMLQDSLNESEVIETSRFKDVRSFCNAFLNVVITKVKTIGYTDEMKLIVKILGRPILNVLQSIDALFGSTDVKGAKEVAIPAIYLNMLLVNEYLEQLENGIANCEMIQNNVDIMNFDISVKLLCHTIYSLKERLNLTVPGLEREMSYESVTSEMVHQSMQDLTQHFLVLQSAFKQSGTVQAIYITDLKESVDKLQKAVIENTAEINEATELEFSPQLISVPLIDLLQQTSSALECPKFQVAEQVSKDDFYEQVLPLRQTIEDFEKFTESYHISANQDIVDFVDAVKSLTEIGQQQEAAESLMSEDVEIEEVYELKEDLSEKMQVTTTIEQLHNPLTQLTEDFVDLQASLKQLEVIEVCHLEGIKEIGEKLHKVVVTVAELSGTTEENEVIKNALDTPVMNIVHSVCDILNCQESGKEIPLGAIHEQVAQLKQSLETANSALVNSQLIHHMDVAQFTESIKSLAQTIEEIDSKCQEEKGKLQESIVDMTKQITNLQSSIVKERSLEKSQIEILKVLTEQVQHAVVNIIRNEGQTAQTSFIENLIERVEKEILCKLQSAEEICVETIQELTVPLEEFKLPEGSGRTTGESQVVNQSSLLNFAEAVKSLFTVINEAIIEQRQETAMELAAVQEREEESKLQRDKELAEAQQQREKQLAAAEKFTEKLDQLAEQMRQFTENVGNLQTCARQSGQFNDNLISEINRAGNKILKLLNDTATINKPTKSLLIEFITQVIEKLTSTPTDVNTMYEHLRPLEVSTSELEDHLATCQSDQDINKLVNSVKLLLQIVHKLHDESGATESETRAVDASVLQSIMEPLHQLRESVTSVLASEDVYGSESAISELTDKSNAVEVLQIMAQPILTLDKVFVAISERATTPDFEAQSAASLLTEQEVNSLRSEFTSVIPALEELKKSTALTMHDQIVYEHSVTIDGVESPSVSSPATATVASIDNLLNSISVLQRAIVTDVPTSAGETAAEISPSSQIAALQTVTKSVQELSTICLATITQSGGVAESLNVKSLSDLDLSIKSCDTLTMDSYELLNIAKGNVTVMDETSSVKSFHEDENARSLAALTALAKPLNEIKESLAVIIDERRAMEYGNESSVLSQSLTSLAKKPLDESFIELQAAVQFAQQAVETAPAFAALSRPLEDISQ